MVFVNRGRWNQYQSRYSSQVWFSKIHKLIDLLFYLVCFQTVQIVSWLSSVDAILSTERWSHVYTNLKSQSSRERVIDNLLEKTREISKLDFRRDYHSQVKHKVESFIYWFSRRNLGQKATLSPLRSLKTGMKSIESSRELSVFGKFIRTRNFTGYHAGRSVETG